MEPNAPVCGTRSVGQRPTEETEANSAVSCEKCLELRENERHWLRQDAGALRQRAHKLWAGIRKKERALKTARNRHSLKVRKEKWNIDRMWIEAEKKEEIAAKLLWKAKHLDRLGWPICPECREKRQAQRDKRFTQKDALPSDLVTRRKPRVRLIS